MSRASGFYREGEGRAITAMREGDHGSNGLVV
jgi:hypothetical protein